MFIVARKELEKEKRNTRFKADYRGGDHLFAAINMELLVKSALEFLKEVDTESTLKFRSNY